MIDGDISDIFLVLSGNWTVDYVKDDGCGGCHGNTSDPSLASYAAMQAGSGLQYVSQFVFEFSVEIAEIMGNFP